MFSAVEILRFWAVAGCALAAIGLRGWRAAAAGAGLWAASGLITRIAGFRVENLAMSFAFALIGLRIPGLRKALGAPCK